MSEVAHSERLAVFSLQARLIALIMLAVFIAGVGWKGYHSGYKARDLIAQAAAAERTAQALAASETNRLRERAMQRTKDEAINAAEKRATIFRRDADAVAVERNGLRDDLAASRSGIAAASCDSVRRYAATVNSVFEQCAARLEEVAGTTQGIASDARTLMDAWPK